MIVYISSLLHCMRSPALAVAEAEAESPHLEIISPPGLLGLKEEARRNVVEILEKLESRSSDSSFTEALRFYTQPECCHRPELKWPEGLCLTFRLHEKIY